MSSQTFQHQSNSTRMILSSCFTYLQFSSMTIRNWTHIIFQVFMYLFDSQLSWPSAEPDFMPVGHQPPTQPLPQKPHAKVHPLQWQRRKEREKPVRKLSSKHAMSPPFSWTKLSTGHAGFLPH